MNRPHRLCLIAAMDRNRVIGHRGRMPWHLPEDLKRFRRITWGKPVLMGRKTFDAIGRPLPGRRNIIVSRSGFTAPGCTVVDSIEAGIALAAGQTLMVIGGATLYRALLPAADCLYLTLIEAEFPGDTFFPDWSAYQWRERSSEAGPISRDFPYSYRFVELVRRQPG